MSTTIKVNLDSVGTILAKRGLQHRGKAQLVMTTEIYKKSVPYTPFDNNPLSTLVTLEPNSITYNVPYAKRMWYGKVMAGNPLAAIDKDVKFQGAPMRGKEWVTRAMIDRKGDVIQAVENFIKEGKDV